MHRRHTYHDVAAAAKVLHLRLFKARFLQRIAHLVQIDRFLKGDFNHRTAGEIEPQLNPRTPMMAIDTISRKPEMPKAQ